MIKSINIPGLPHSILCEETGVHNFCSLWFQMFVVIFLLWLVAGPASVVGQDDEDEIRALIVRVIHDIRTAEMIVSSNDHQRFGEARRNIETHCPFFLVVTDVLHNDQVKYVY